MAQDNVLGIQATINGKSIQQGADEFIAQISRMEQASDKFVNQLAGKSKMVNGQVESIGVSFDSVVNTISKGAAALGIAFSAQQFVTQVAKTRGEFQQLEVAFNTMLGSAEKASSLMQQITTTAAVTPFGLKEVADGAKSLLAYGVASDKVNDTLVRLGDIASGLSIPLKDLVMLYGTTMTQGQMFTQDLRQFQGRGIPLADELAKQFRVTKDEVGDLVTAGRVGFAQLEKAIISMTSEGGKFGGLMEAQSKTILGQWSNIEDAIDGMFNEIGKSSEGFINTALEGVSTLVGNYEKVGEAIGVMVTAYGSYRAAMLVGMAVQKAESAITAEAAVQKRLAALAGHELSIAQAKGAATSVLYASAQKMVAASLMSVAKATVLNPYVLAAAAITGLVYGVYKLATAETSAEIATRKHNEEMEKQAKAFEDRKNRIESLIDIIKDETETEFERTKAYEELSKLSPKLVSAYSMEQIATMDIAKATKLLNNERDKLAYDAQQKKVAKYTEELKKLREERAKAAANDTSGNAYGYIAGLDKSIEQTEADLEVAQRQIAEMDNIKRKAEQQSKPVEVRLMEAKANRDQILQEYLVAKKALEDAQKKFGENPLIQIPFEVQLDFNNAQTALKNVDNEIETLNGLTKEETYREAYKKAEADWKAKKKALEDAKKGTRTQYKKAKEDFEAAEETFESLGGDTTGKKAEKDKQEAKKRGEELLAIRRQNQEAEIELMKDGAEKKKAQLEHEFNLEMDAIEKQSNEWKEAQKGKLTDEQHIELGSRRVKAEDKYVSGIAKVTKEETDAAKLAMNEYLKEYGSWQEKRKAITYIYTKKIDEAKTQGLKLSLAEKMKRELAAVDDAAHGSTTTIAQLFKDMSSKTVASMREIADEAELILDYINAGKWEEFGKTGKDASGFTKEQYELLRLDAGQLKAIQERIKGVRKEADDLEPVLTKASKALKNIFSGNYSENKFQEELGKVLEGARAVTQAAEFLGDSLSTISEAFGGNFLGGIAEGIGVATDAANAAMSGAEAGKVFGPWGAAAGAAIGAISSLASSFSKLHDRKHEQKIQKIAEQIEVLEKNYEALGEKVEDAYSKKASGLIDEQNKLLEQQKLLIQNQIKEEESKKKTDANRIKEWQQQIEDINKTIKDNKEAAVDAIFGSDLQSAIDNFASAYVDAWSAGEDKAKSVKDVVKNMIKSMITESIKAAASDPMKAVREKLLQFWADDYINEWEQNYLNQMVENLQKDLDAKFAWADGIMKEDSSYSQEASSKGFQSMSQETASELNGRFTALQIAGEEIKKQSEQQTVLQTLISTDTTAIKHSIETQNNYISEIVDIQYESVGYLSEISKNTKQLYQMNERLGKIEENTRNL